MGGCDGRRFHLEKLKRQEDKEIREGCMDYRPTGTSEVSLILFNRITFQLKSYLQHLKTTCGTSTRQKPTKHDNNQVWMKKGISQGVGSGSERPQTLYSPFQWHTFLTHFFAAHESLLKLLHVLLESQNLGLWREAVNQSWLSLGDRCPCLNRRRNHPYCCKTMSWGKRGRFQHHDERQKPALAPRKWTHIE